MRSTHDTKSLLKLLKAECDNQEVTNLSQWFREWNTDVSLSTIMSQIGIVKNVDGLWTWIAEDPTEDMAYEIRHVTNIYKNYSI